MNLTELYVLLDDEDIELFDRPLPNTRAMSHMSITGNCYIALDAKQFDSVAAEKVALAHEIGHCITGSFYNRYSAHDIRGLHERRADKTAMHMLLPLDELVEAFESGCATPFELSEHFQVDMDFVRSALEMYEQDLKRIYHERHGEEE